MVEGTTTWRFSDWFTPNGPRHCGDRGQSEIVLRKGMEEGLGMDMATSPEKHVPTNQLNHMHNLKLKDPGTSLAVQWLRAELSLQGARV